MSLGSLLDLQLQPLLRTDSALVEKKKKGRRTQLERVHAVTKVGRAEGKVGEKKKERERAREASLEAAQPEVPSRGL